MTQNLIKIKDIVIDASKIYTIKLINHPKAATKKWEIEIFMGNEDYESIYFEEEGIAEDYLEEIEKFLDVVEIDDEEEEDD